MILHDTPHGARFGPALVREDCLTLGRVDGQGPVFGHGARQLAPALDKRLGPALVTVQDCLPPRLPANDRVTVAWAVSASVETRTRVCFIAPACHAGARMYMQSTCAGSHARTHAHTHICACVRRPAGTGMHCSHPLPCTFASRPTT